MCAGSLAAAHNVASDLSHMRAAKSRRGERTGGHRAAYLAPESAGTAQMKRPGCDSISGAFRQSIGRAERQGSSRGSSERDTRLGGERCLASGGGEREGEASRARAGELERQRQHAERIGSNDGRDRGNPDNRLESGGRRGSGMDTSHGAAILSAIASCNKFPRDGSFLDAYKRTAEHSSAQHQERAGEAAAGAVAHAAHLEEHSQEHEKLLEGRGAGSSREGVGSTDTGVRMAPAPAGGNYSMAAALRGTLKKRAHLQGLPAPVDAGAPTQAKIHVLPQVDAQVCAQSSRDVTEAVKGFRDC
jgi:hypothetical protein